MMPAGKMTQVLSELLGAEASTQKLEAMLADGWKIVHREGTAFVSLGHERGGKQSLIECCVYGTSFTTGEADKLAKIVAVLLSSHFQIKQLKESRGR